MLAVTRAARSFDPSRGVPFAGFALVCARREMCRLAALQGAPVRLPKVDPRRKAPLKVERVNVRDAFAARTSPSPEPLFVETSELVAAARGR